MAEIILSAQEADLAVRIGFARQSSKKNFPDHRVSPRHDSFEVHARGFASEIAMCRWLGVDPDAPLSRKGNASVAAEIAGVKIDANFNSLQWGGLRYFPKRVPNVDAMVLIVPGRRRMSFCIVGWCTRDHFLERARLVELPGQGRRWLLEQGELRPPNELLLRLGLRERMESIQARLFS